MNAEGFISYRQNWYSTPWLYIGRVLPVRITEDEVIVYGPQVEEIARHRLFARTVTGQRDPRFDRAGARGVLFRRVEPGARPETG